MKPAPPFTALPRSGRLSTLCWRHRWCRKREPRAETAVTATQRMGPKTSPTAPMEEGTPTAAAGAAKPKRMNPAVTHPMSPGPVGRSGKDDDIGVWVVKVVKLSEWRGRVQVGLE